MFSSSHSALGAAGEVALRIPAYHLLNSGFVYKPSLQGPDHEAVVDAVTRQTTCALQVMKEFGQHKQRLRVFATGTS